MSRYLSFGYLATILGGLLLATGASLQAVNAGVGPFSVQVTTGMFALATGLRLVGTVLALIGITAVYVRESDAAGRFGLVSYVLVVFGLVLQLGWMWSDLFVAGALASQAPGILDGTTEAGRLDIAFLVAWLMNTTLVLLGIATLRARVYPRMVGWALIVAGAVTLVPLPVDGPVYEIAIGIALAVAGVGARSVRGEDDLSVAPGAVVTAS